MGHNPTAGPMRFALAVNDEVKAGMARSGISSNRKLADALGVSSDYVNRRIAGKVPWDFTDLERLASLFGVKPSDLTAAAAQRSGL